MPLVASEGTAKPTDFNIESDYFLTKYDVTISISELINPSVRYLHSAVSLNLLLAGARNQ
jgi:hypothetical protein